jgi:hypothetical protein
MDAQQPAPAIAGRVVLSPGMPSKFLLILCCPELLRQRRWKIN